MSFGRRTKNEIHEDGICMYAGHKCVEMGVRTRILLVTNCYTTQPMCLIPRTKMFNRGQKLFLTGH
jgi:hypothetical protein